MKVMEVYASNALKRSERVIPSRSAEDRPQEPVFCAGTSLVRRFFNKGCDHLWLRDHHHVRGTFCDDCVL
jgi:hypothetical protein